VGTGVVYGMSHFLCRIKTKQEGGKRGKREKLIDILLEKEIVVSHKAFRGARPSTTPALARSLALLISPNNTFHPLILMMFFLRLTIAPSLPLPHQL
jgi:hypothetical protein